MLAERALDLDRPEIAQLEEVSEQPPGRGPDHDAVGCSQALQSCRQVGRFADDAALLRVAGADEIPHDRQARANALE